MPAPQGGPNQSGNQSAADILHNSVYLLNADIDITGRLPEPNSSLLRAEVSQIHGRPLTKVVVRLDAKDIGELILAGAGDNRMEEALSAPEIGAIALSRIMNDARNYKEGFDVMREGGRANLSVKVHHHKYTDQQLADPEFLESEEARIQRQKSYVEFMWTAHEPPHHGDEHGIPILVVNTMIHGLKTQGYERHWETAIQRFHPDWDKEHDNKQIELLFRQTDEVDLGEETIGKREIPDVSNLRQALRSNLDLILTDPRPNLDAYIENDSLIRIRLPLSEGMINNRREAEQLAYRIEEQLEAAALDGSFTAGYSEGGVPHLVIHYYFRSGKEDSYRAMEVVAAHQNLYLAIESERALFADSIEPS